MILNTTVNIYQQNNPQYFNELKNLVAHSKKWAIQVNANGRKKELKYGIFPKYYHLKKWINDITPLLANDSYTLMTKVFWILNNITDWNNILVKCKNCGKPFINKNVVNTYVGYFKFCSVKCASSFQETRDKVATTNTQKYGCHPSCIKEIKEKRKKTCFQKYGNENFNNCEKASKTRFEHFGKYAPDDFKDKCCKTKIKHGHSCNWNNFEQIKKTRFAKNNGAYESEQSKLKRQQTSLNHYGVKFTLQATEVKEKSKQTCLKKYGVAYVTQDENFKKQAKQTCLRKYGVEYSQQNSEISKKSKTKYKLICIQKYGATSYFSSEAYKKYCIEKYGCEHPMQNHDILMKQQMNSKKKYSFQEISFDSAPEIAFYIWLSDNNIHFEYQPNITFEYEFEGKKHFYMPDFLVENQLIELKGSQFLKEDGTWKNPFDNSQDDFYEAKHQCLIENNVKILYPNDYKKYLDYIVQIYGKDYLKKFKNN